MTKDNLLKEMLSECLNHPFHLAMNREINFQGANYDVYYLFLMLPAILVTNHVLLLTCSPATR